MLTRLVDVRFVRYDGVVKRQVVASLLGECGGEIRLAVPFGSRFHTLRGPWTPPTAAIYHFWREGWHNVCTIVSAKTRRPAFLYCDIHAPPDFDEERLTVIDLDLDVIVYPDRSFRIQDEEEFAANSIALGYPEAFVRGARAALASLTESLRAGRGLFTTDRFFSLAPDEAAALGLDLPPPVAEERAREKFGPTRASD
ncbi:MAG: DUF402 domain-containing protein [Chloroflexota bacterium]|nr:DUF402 domain-containing protein [Dehalococcoidia bacterium]MDW8253784.1 DUF402 domain-containing protein [Chloroflexota bacterium]